MVHCLLAQDGLPGPFDGKVAVLMAVATLVGGAITWAFNALNKVRGEKRREQKEAEKTIVDHLQELNGRLMQECEECHGEIEDVRRERDEARLQSERRLGHIRYCEHLLRSRRVNFEPYAEGGSSHEIPAAPPHLRPRPKPAGPGPNPGGAGGGGP